MDLVPGTRLQIVRLAPPWDTMEIGVGSTQDIVLRAGGSPCIGRSSGRLVTDRCNRSMGKPPARAQATLGGRTFRERKDGLGIQPGVQSRAYAPDVRPLRLAILPDHNAGVLGERQAQHLIVEPLDNPDG